MTYKINIKNITNDSVYFFCFITFLIPWISLFSLSGFEIRFFHISVFILLVKKLFFKRPNIKMSKQSTPLTFLFLLCFILFFVSVFWSNDIVSGFSLFFKNFIYFLSFLLLSDFFLREKDFFLIKIIKYSKWAIYAFIALNFFIYIVMGELFFFNAIEEIIFGNSSGSNYKYFIKIINFKFSDFTIKTWGDEGFHKPKFRNVFGISALIIYSILDYITNPSRYEKALKIFLIFLILFSQSRSTLLIFCVILFLKFALNKLSLKLLIFLLLTPIVVIIFMMFIDISVFNRFLDLAKDARIEMYINTIRNTLNHSFLGSGFGTKIESHDKLFYVHNFILAGVFSSGILGLFLTFFTVSELVVQIYNRVKFSKRYKYCFIYGLPILVLFRMMIGGNNGLPSFQDWFALSVFFTLLFINKEELKVQ